VSPAVPIPRFGERSCVPGWDEAVDLTKDAAVVPDSAMTAVPEKPSALTKAMAKCPDRHSAVILALHIAQARGARADGDRPYLVVCAQVFFIGASGVLTRRNPLVILLCLELMLNDGQPRIGRLLAHVGR
jgi:hypothetical protein